MRKPQTALLVTTLSGPVIAQDMSTQAQAEALFQEGVELMETGKFDSACPKLLSSHQLDPAPGTMLNLAHCYERSGKLASAWAAYASAATEGDKAGRRSWAEQARRKAAELEPKLNRLLISVESNHPNLAVTRNGTPIPEPAWGVPLPVDDGAHLIKVDAPGHAPWNKTIEVHGTATIMTVVVPALEPMTAEPPSSHQTPIRTEPTTNASTDAGTDSSTLPVLGLAAAGVGVLATGAGVWFGLSARSKRDTAFDDGRCVRRADSTVCTSEGTSDLDAARSDATVSTVTFGLGATLIVGGLATYFLSSSTGPETAARRKPAVGVTAQHDAFALAVQGEF
jgi:hypothetical protein